MADTSDLSPEVLHALKTGELPPDPNADAATTAEEAHPADAERLRAKYHQMVQEYIDIWLDDHPNQGNRLPETVRHEIEDACNRQIQYEWRQLLRREEDTED